MTSVVQTLILGLLVGALYALMASGLTLIFGVMRVINLAHGAFAVLAAFLTFTLWRNLGLDPLLSIPIVMAVMFGFGWVIYVLIIQHVRSAHVTMTVLALISRAAHSGRSRTPYEGYSTPAAKGIGVKASSRLLYLDSGTNSHSPARLRRMWLMLPPTSFLSAVTCLGVRGPPLRQPLEW